MGNTTLHKQAQVTNTVWTKRSVPDGTVTLTCSTGSMQTTVPRAYLQSLGYSAMDVSVNDPTCRPQVTEYLVKFNISYRRCGTVKTVDARTITYSNNIHVSPHRKTISHRKKLSMDLHCKMSQQARLDIAYKPEETIKINKTQYGHFDMSVSFYHSSSFQKRMKGPPYLLSPNQKLYVEVVLLSSDPDLQLFVDSCVASPSQTNFKSQSYYLIHNGCIQDSTYKTLPSKSNKHARFSFGAFAFLSKNNGIYVHCELLVCSQSDPSSRCQEVHYRRRRRSLGSYLKEIEVVLGPVQLVNELANTTISETET